MDKSDDFTNVTEIETKVTSELETFYNIFKMYVGVGIFTIPYAFAKVGIIGGPVILILFACLSYYTMSL